MKLNDFSINMSIYALEQGINIGQPRLNRKGITLNPWAVPHKNIFKIEYEGGHTTGLHIEHFNGGLGFTPSLGRSWRFRMGDDLTLQEMWLK
jgi:hypothetical protein